MATTQSSISLPDRQTVPADPPVHFTAAAVAKLQQILEDRGVSTALRLGVVGGGCSGFKYSMQVENTLGPMDKVFVIDWTQDHRRRHFAYVSPRRADRLHRYAGRIGIHLRQSERHQHLPVRIFLQGIIARHVMDIRGPFSCEGVQ
jgi:hypothetical protein